MAENREDIAKTAFIRFLLFAFSRKCIDKRYGVVYTRTRLSAQIAQSVEQRTENPRVTGSIPVLGIVRV